MRKLGFAITAALAAALTFGATAAGAQSWGYDEYQADRSYHKAHVFNHRAAQEQRAANEAAWYGDYASADYYARAAAHDHHQAWKSNRWARHKDHEASWDYWYGGGWGY